VPFMSTRKLQMPVGHKNRVDGWSRRKGRRGGVLRTQRERRSWNNLGSYVREVARHSSERTVSQVVENSESSAEHGRPIRSLTELIRDSHARRNVCMGCLIQLSAARRQGDCRWIVQARYRERLVRQVLALKGRINLPSQSIRRGQPRRDFPRVLAI